MKIKTIIIISVVSLVSFAASFMAFMLIRKNISQANASQQTAEQQNNTDLTTAGKTPKKDQSDDNALLAATQQKSASLSEEQLRSYIFDLREQMSAQESRLNLVKTREQQLEVTRGIVEDNVKELETLRVELASLLAKIRTEQENLQKNMLEISEIEKQNLLSISATYDKMNSASASKIVTNMCKVSPRYDSQNPGIDDAVKILKYMTERTRAKLIAEVADTEPTLASVLCNRLKYTVEKG